MSRRSKPTVTAVRPIDDGHQVLTVQGGSRTYRRWPCAGCPWRVDQTGVFPPGAFYASARTAYDLAEHTFGCHEAGVERPAICAGFLLRGADHNLRGRMMAATGEVDLAAVHDGGHALHHDYVAMAVANGCDPDDPRLARCRRTVPAPAWPRFAEPGRARHFADGGD